jgi:hypothetical protein
MGNHQDLKKFVQKFRAKHNGNKEKMFTFLDLGGEASSLLPLFALLFVASNFLREPYSIKKIRLFGLREKFCLVFPFRARNFFENRVLKFQMAKK